MLLHQRRHHGPIASIATQKDALRTDGVEHFPPSKPYVTVARLSNERPRDWPPWRRIGTCPRSKAYIEAMQSPPDGCDRRWGFSEGIAA